MEYNYYISNKGLVEVSDKEENLEVTGAAPASCLKRRLQNVLSNVTYSPSHCQTGIPITNTYQTLRTAPDLCTNVSLAVFLVATVIHIQYLRTQIYVYIYIYTLSSQYRENGMPKEINNNWRQQ